MSLLLRSSRGTENDGTLWIGSSRAFAQVGGTGGSLYRLKLSQNRKKIDLSDPKLAESESLIVGKGFGWAIDKISRK